MGTVLNIPTEEYGEDKFPDLTSVPAGEYHLRIFSVKESTGKPGGGWEGRVFWNVGFVIEDGDPSVDLTCSKDVYTNILLPDASLARDPKQHARDMRSFRYFILAFNIPTEDVDPEDGWVGLDGGAILTEEDDPEYGSRNNIARFQRWQ